MLAKCIAEVLTSKLADTFRQAYAPNLQSCLQMRVLSIAEFFKIKKDGLFPSFLILVELAGIEPASENHLIQLSP